ncbi:helix-turn-helix transcriptional regulator [Pseudonocardia endophytica]|uniref:GAF domain-containing protein n=1 Tax=Pseudonocardia endophytica TaxID=401976 RepID=A0A4V2PHN2_PSEEN|nr:LuxR C-terminal-related transcriptional regulator [Pseudonocardia endophytica]TCK21376.1 GAF domain-containing protein [Pseudonocardia endophytica]
MGVAAGTGVLGRLRALTPVDMAFAASVDVSGSSFVLDRFDGARSGSLRGVRSAVGDGLGGRCIALARPVYVRDYVAARGITHQYDGAVSAEGLRSIIAIPVFDGDVVREVVYAGSRGRSGFGERLVDRTVEIVRRHTDTKPDVRAELRDIAAAVSDPALRRRLEDLVDRVGEQPEPEPPVVALTPREHDVLVEVALGHGNRTVAQRLGLTEQTAKSYLKSAMSKLDSHTRGEAVHRARESGLLP